MKSLALPFPIIYSSSLYAHTFKYEMEKYLKKTKRRSSTHNNNNEKIIIN